MTVQIVVLDGDTAGQMIPLGDKPVTVGRISRNTLVLTDPSVSRQHAKLFLKSDSVWLVDLQSSHGTRVNGVRITRTELEVGDEIHIGKSRLRLEGVGADAPPDEPDDVAGLRTDTLPPPPVDDGFSLEMPDELLPSKPSPRPKPPPAAASDDDGLAPDGFDPFAEEDEHESTRAQSSAFGVSKPSKTGPGGRGRPAPPRPEGANVLQQDLGQHAAPVRWLAILVAIVLTVGAGYLLMRLVAGDGAPPDTVPITNDDTPRNTGPIRPTTENPRGS